MKRSALVALALCACGSGPKKEPIDFGEQLVSQPAAEPAPPPAVGPAKPVTCATAGDNVKVITSHVSATLSANVVAHCEAERWSAEVVQCLIAAIDGPGISLCLALLPPAQRTALEAQNVAVVRAPDDACAAFAAPAPTIESKPELGNVPGLPGVSPVRRSIAPKELEALRLGGDTQIVPDAEERRLLFRCKVARVSASFKVCIDTSGAPALIERVKTSSLPKYDERLAHAIAAWRYRPLFAEGRAVAACSSVTFAFSEGQ